MTKEKTEKKELYSAKLIMLGREYTSTGSTVLEALDKLNPPRAIGRGILVVSKGKKSREKILTPIMLTKLFTRSRVTREVALKQASLLFADI